MPRDLRRFERAREDAFIGGQPAEADASEQGNQFRTDRAFRRPQALRRPAERGGMILNSQTQLGFGIFRRTKA